jgi:hypothetical protein
MIGDLMLFARCRGLLLPIAAAFCTALTTPLLGRQSVPAGVLMDVGRPEVFVPASNLAALLIALSLYRLAHSPMEQLEATAALPMHRYRCIAWAGTSSVAALLLVAAYCWSQDGAAGVIVGRNLAGFVGLTLIGLRFNPGVGWLLAPIFVGNEVFFGATQSGTAQSWAWSLLGPVSRTGMGIAAALLVAGVLFLRSHWRAQTMTRPEIAD